MKHSFLSSEIGVPYNTRIITDDEYGGHPQVNDIVQDHRGIMYFTNLDGVVEYDGVNWNQFPIGVNSVALSLTLGADSMIYVGGEGDIGYLAPNGKGEMEFVSLLDHLPEDQREFRFVWETHSTPEGVVFLSNWLLARWDGTSMQTWTPRVDTVQTQSEDGLPETVSREFYRSYLVNDRLYVFEKQVGLQELRGDSLALVTGGERFAQKSIFGVMKTPDKESIIIGTREGSQDKLELTRFDGRDYYPINVDPFFDRDDMTFYFGTTIPGDFLALGTTGHGAYIVNQEGTLMRMLSENVGLPRDVNRLYPDSQGGLWIGYNDNGIARLNAASPITVFGEEQQLTGSLRHATRHRDTFYVATTQTLLKLIPASPENQHAPAHFEEVPGINQTVRYLASVGDELLAGTEADIYRIRNGRAEPLDIQLEVYYHLDPSEYHAGRLFAGTDNGYRVLERRGDRWVTIQAGLIGQEVLSIEEENANTVWFTSSSSSTPLHRITFNAAGNRVTAHEELPTVGNVLSDYLRPSRQGNTLVFASNEGVFRYDPSKSNGTPYFELDPNFKIPDRTQGDSLISFQITDNSLWSVYDDRVEIAFSYTDSTVGYAYPGSLTLPKWEGSNFLVVEDDGIAWIGSSLGLVRYDPHQPDHDQYKKHFPPLIRGISSVWSDVGVPIMQMGTYSNEEGGRSNQAVALEKLASTHNSLVVHFVMPEYNLSRGPSYSYKLHPMSVDWQRVESNELPRLTDLSPGKYTFEVRAGTRRTEFINDAKLSFRILPPWYATGWAYLGYSIGFFLLALGAGAYAKARKRIQVLEHERMIYERMRFANTRLREANQTLKQANVMKDEFLANASHELRTPLTAILGFTSLLQDELTGESQNFIGLIDQNSQRLLSIVTNLLDLAKLRSGATELVYKRMDMSEKTMIVADMLSPLAQNKGLWLRTHVPDHPVFAELDASCYERIIINLVGNAIKFTQAGGIDIRVFQQEGEVHVAVEDTGVGIEESFMPHLFEEFQQAPSNQPQPAGSGLGLTITAQLVEVMDGRIDVVSKKGVGTTFTVTFPMYHQSNGYSLQHEEHIPDHS